MQFNSVCFYLNISETGGQLWAPPEILFLGQRSGHELRVVNVAGSIHNETGNVKRNASHGRSLGSPPWNLYILLLANLLAFYLAYLLAFYLANILALYLAYLLAFYLTFYLAFWLAYLLAYLLTFYLAYLLALYLAYLMAFYLAYLLAFYLAFEVQRCALS